MRKQLKAVKKKSMKGVVCDFPKISIIRQINPTISYIVSLDIVIQIMSHLDYACIFQAFAN